MVKAVFFDLYETLITEWDGNTKKAAYSTGQLGLDQEIFKAEWDNRREERMNGTFPDHQSVLRDILNSHGLTIDHEWINKIHVERVRAKGVPFQDMNPEVVELLQSLKSGGIKLGLISNCAPEEVYSWNSCKLANYFDTVIFSYEVKCAKPNRQIYQIACEKLGVAPEECLFVGDGGANELTGAREAGMQAYHATWFLPDEFSKKISGFPKLEEPLELLDQLSVQLSKKG